MKHKLRRQLVKSVVGVTYTTLMLGYAKIMSTGLRKTLNVNLEILLSNHKKSLATMYIATTVAVVLTGLTYEFRLWISKAEHKAIRKRNSQKKIQSSAKVTYISQ